MQQIPFPSVENNYLRDHVSRLHQSFHFFTGKSLLDIDDKEEVARKLFYAPFVLISHGTEVDPIFNYANECALQLFEMSWKDFINLPSRKSAEQDTQAERDRLLSAVSDKGFIDDYSGIRISGNGKRFEISNATVWNIILDDEYFGQAARIKEWRFLDQ